MPPPPPRLGGPTASGASWEPPSGRRSSGRARRPRPTASARRRVPPKSAGGVPRGGALGHLAVVLPGSPLHLLGREPPDAEACHHRAVGPLEDQDVRVEARPVSGRQPRV